MHEVFEAPKGMYEAVYINFQPTLLGATTYLKRGDKLEGGNVPDQWVGSLLDANRGRMRTSVGRRGQKSADADKDKFGKNYYVWKMDCGLGILVGLLAFLGRTLTMPWDPEKELKCSYGKACFELAFLGPLDRLGHLASKKMRINHWASL
jgi:hypothetical protein